MEKWMMIGNPASASATTGNAWNKVVEKLKAAGLEVEVAATERKAHAIELAKEAAAKGFRKFIAAGGDGTVHEVMTGLLRYAAPRAVKIVLNSGSKEAKEMAKKRKEFKKDPNKPHTGNAVNVEELMK